MVLLLIIFSDEETGGDPKQTDVDDEFENEIFGDKNINVEGENKDSRDKNSDEDVSDEEEASEEEIEEDDCKQITRKPKSVFLDEEADVSEGNCKLLFLINLIKKKN